MKILGSGQNVRRFVKLIVILRGHVTDSVNTRMADLLFVPHPDFGHHSYGGGIGMAGGGHDALKPQLFESVS